GFDDVRGCAPEDAVGALLRDGYVAGAKPAVVDGGRRFGGSLPVLEEHGRAANLDLARRAGRDWRTRLVDEANVDPRQWLPHESRPSLPMKRVRERHPDL